MIQCREALRMPKDKPNPNPGYSTEIKEINI